MGNDTATQLIDTGIQSQSLHRLKCILSQKYFGDINIVPRIRLSKYFGLLSNPSIQVMHEYVMHGERITWPHMPIIQNHLLIEQCLNRVLLECKQRALRREHLLITQESDETLTSLSGEEDVEEAQNKNGDVLFKSVNGSPNRLRRTSSCLN
jgi:hypothetical protein